MRVTPALAICVTLFVAIWWLYPHIAESAHMPAEPIAIQRLAPPAGFTASDENPDTAFRESEAGFSAYHRVRVNGGGTNDSNGSALLTVSTITDKLTHDPDDSDPVLAGAGKEVEIGLNFGILELPMHAAAISPAPTETVTVYYDNTGWIVAYLPKGRAPAAIWKYKSIADTTNQEKLKNNLLVLAINEVLKADGKLPVSHSNVKYYDWENQTCDAFVLFSAVANGVKSNTVKFVVPGSIGEIGASAAVVIAEQAQGGDSVTASVKVDDKTVAAANGSALRKVAGFGLVRESVDTESYKTSLHTVVVDVSDDNTAAGVVMLVYNKPGG